MNLSLKPASSLKGAISLPSSKSYSIRAFIIAALGGKSKISNASDCEDARMARLTCQKIGARLTRLSSNSWSVKGLVKDRRFPRQINVGESGTTLRFLISILALSSHPVTINAAGTLLGRPNHHLIRVLRKHGANIRGKGEKETAPINIKPARLKGGLIEIDGTLSSQFISSLLIALPNLKEDSRIKINGSYMVSRPYIEMTRVLLQKAGIKVRVRNLREYSVKGSQRFRGLRNFVVPDDYGLAAFFLVAASLLKSKIILKRNSRDDLIQADKNILFLLRKMGARINISADKIILEGPVRLKGGNFSLRDCPDLTPIMAIAALFAKGKTTLYGISHVRVKESNRISDLRRELSKAGARIQETRDSLVIHPGQKLKSGIRLNPHRDHRLAMAFCILGIKVGAVVEDVECIAKSYPAFLKDLKRVKGRF